MESSHLIEIPKSYKLVILGDSAVGKSCIVSRFTKNHFDDFQESTIGASFATIELEVDNRQIKYEIWDTAGQERYRSLAPMYYRGAKFAVIVYDITSKISFEGAKSWINEMLNHGNSECILILVGNKSDLESNRSVSEEEGKNFADESNILFIEVSAKTSKNIKNIFINLAKELPEEEEEPIVRQNLIYQKPKRTSKCCF